MEQIADRLAGKIHRLTPDQMAEVERFVESLSVWESHCEAARMASAISTPVLEAVWSNPEDEVYDAV